MGYTHEARQITDALAQILTQWRRPKKITPYRSRQMFLRVLGIYLGVGIGYCLNQDWIVFMWVGLIFLAGICLGSFLVKARNGEAGGE